jgi:hypothetical protein
VVYDRTIRGRELNFEASGGLKNAALVMRDRETDSWWGMIAGRALGGPMNNEPLVEIASSEKVSWGAWKARYPDTKILSVDGVTHVVENHYDRYFTSDSTFRGLEVEDARLPSKAAVFAFRWMDQPFAIAHQVAEGGAAFPLDKAEKTWIVVYREPDEHLFSSTRGALVKAEEVRSEEGTLELRVHGEWKDLAELGNAWIPTESLAPEATEDLQGFDTFWYTWAATVDGTTILK